jgi:sulfatase modifying factor 1
MPEPFATVMNNPRTRPGRESKRSLRLRSYFLAGTVGAVALGGCVLTFDVDRLVGGENVDATCSQHCDDASVDAPLDDSGRDADVPDGGALGRGPTMIDAGTFRIDSTEVTQAQYAAFVAEKAGNTSNQLPECTWNNSYAPAKTCPYDPVGLANHPVRGADWCDAVEFCRWAGKHLCGARDGGAPLPFDASTNPSTSEWLAACTNFEDGLHVYPYGDTYSPGACNLEDSSNGGPVPVASLAQCVGGLPGLHDMSGNLWEWVNSCEPTGTSGSPDVRCTLMGGSYNGSSFQARCTGTYRLPRDGNLECQNGFRCCDD